MNDSLRVAAYVTYLVAWGVVAVTTVMGALPGQRSNAPAAGGVSRSVIAGTLAQLASALVITLTLPAGPLRPGTAELAGALALAPLGAGIYVWAVRTGRRAAQHAPEHVLVTDGAYAFVRHPIYLAFFALLVATGLLASGEVKLLIAAALYLAGSEIRIAHEESELAARFPDSYPAYRVRTRWRYLPGLR